MTREYEEPGSLGITTHGGQRPLREVIFNGKTHPCTRVSSYSPDLTCSGVTSFPPRRPEQQTAGRPHVFQRRGSPPGCAPRRRDERQELNFTQICATLLPGAQAIASTEDRTHLQASHAGKWVQPAVLVIASWGTSNNKHGGPHTFTGFTCRSITNTALVVLQEMYLYCDHHGDPGWIPGGFTPGILHVGIVLDDATCQCGFLGVLPFPPPLHSSAAPS
ncbi:hypothetical protein PR048_027893 [Dryococelus australis]|uniref:Uncharacterized protein n=1 Tax=Dryococelus australis TaxID=614101 RepID=A0ABQ9GHQ1_9NEOP|nr:hypothetical protein PR048_027893 [Dryococelus australis]